MPPKRKTRLYMKNGRFYADFRDLGGGQVALIPPGERRATADPDVAAALLTTRLRTVMDAQQDRARQVRDTALGIVRPGRAELAAYAARHLRLKAEEGNGSDGWLALSQVHLQEAVTYFGARAELGSLTPADTTGYVEHLRRKSNGRGGLLTESSVRTYLNALSNLYRRAVSEGKATGNPVSNMFSKPTPARVEARYLEPHEAALLLEAARTLDPTPPATQAHGGTLTAKPNPHVYPILATFLLTGGRKSEILGLEVDDVSFRLGRIYIRPNRWRRLKTKGSKRSIPLWPQLAAILRDYMAQRERSGGLGCLLFPSNRLAPEGMIVDLRKALDTIGQRAGLPAGYVHLHMLRHTYTAARIQTLDRGAPVSLYTVARELGHSGTAMIEDRYGHLHDRAQAGASEVVEYRVEHWADRIGERLEALDRG